jgi:two-component system, cell cycle sensor histidine kinase and response regulator CckA
MLQERSRDSDDVNLLSSIESSAVRSADLLKQLLIFARGIEGERIPVHPESLLKGVAAIAREMFPRSIQVSLDIEKGVLPFKGDPAQMHQALLKLCVNAREAMPSGGILRLRARNLKDTDELPVGLKPELHILIEVQDTGNGIPASIQDRVFEPFFSTKDRTQGAGLGLSTVHGIVRSHQGSIHLRSAPGSGTTFRLVLPALEEKANGTGPAPELLEGHGESLLLVEDDAGLREVTHRTLSQHGYQVTSASDGVDALGLLAKSGGKVRLILTHINAPGMDGPTLARAARRVDPRVRIVASSALGRSLGQSDKLTALQSLGISRLLAKPYTTQELLRAVRDELNEKQRCRSAELDSAVSRS